jgi:hypothetical protein
MFTGAVVYVRFFFLYTSRVRSRTSYRGQGLKELTTGVCAFVMYVQPRVPRGPLKLQLMHFSFRYCCYYKTEIAFLFKPACVYLKGFDGCMCIYIYFFFHIYSILFSDNLGRQWNLLRPKNKNRIFFSVLVFDMITPVYSLSL